MDCPGLLRSRSVSANFLLMLLVFTSGTLRADSVRTTVTFDTSYLVVCRDVTTPKANESHPSEKLIEAKFEISSLVHERSEELLELLYRIESPRLVVRVVDYLPRTKLDTAYAGNVSVDRGNESSRSLGAGVAGNYQPTLSGNVSASRGNKDTTKYHYELLPPLELVAASGTLRRGTGAYFKIKASPRVALEGSRQFVIVMRVPQARRADYVRVSCEALGGGRGGAYSFGRSRFLVALYMDGDLEARDAAATFVLAERRLRSIAAAKQREISLRSFPSFPFRVVRALSVVDPKIPDDWLDQIMSCPPDADPSDFLDHLPQEVLAAAQKYRRAKVDLLRMYR